jgi:two-component system response regulator BaeR
MNDNDKLILIVEDEPTLAQILMEYVEQSGMKAHVINDGATVIEWVKANQPDLILLDLMLPHRDGLDIYRELRTFSQTPVIMATAKVDEIDRLLGLELGADDYICKPYSIREVVARIKNVLRRSVTPTLVEQPPEKAILTVDEDKMKATYKDNALPLTPAEFKLLAFMFSHQGNVYNREQLMNHIYPDNRLVFDRTIDSHIKNLRRKLQAIDAECDFVKSIYGVGYKFEM